MHEPDDRAYDDAEQQGDVLFAEPFSSPPRRGFAPPLLAGMAAAVLFAFVVGFFLLPSASIGDPSDSRTRWTGQVGASFGVRADASGGPSATAPSVPEFAGAELTPVRDARDGDDAAGAAAPALALAAPERTLSPAAMNTLSAPGQVGLVAADAGTATPTQAPGQDSPRAPTARVLRPDPVAARVQTLLNGFGYQAGPADGLAGRVTWSAIEQFRLDRGLPLDSPLTLALVDQLEAARESGWRPPLAAASGPFGPAAMPGDAEQGAMDRTLQRVPGLRAMAPPERHVLERWCTSGRNVADLEGYYRCLSDALRALAAQPALPELAAFDARALAGLRQDCQGGPHAAAPDVYFACLRRGLAGLAPADLDATQVPVGAPHTVAPVMVGERSAS
ncbi:MAG: peptidoglycan-binding domain-containing protein [Burkholderiaceae bacterium]